MQPLMIIVSGPPASGKSSIARRLASDLVLPYVGKDDIKERLFDTLGVGDRDWSRKLGAATYELLYWFIGLYLEAGHSLIAESNFRAQVSGPQFARLQARYPFTAYQVICRIDPAVLEARFRERWHSGQRHPGHVDHVAIVDVLREGDAAYVPMPLDGPRVILDTTDWNAIDFDGLIADLRRYREGRP